MKIVYCIPGMSNPGGMERVLTIKANYLVSKGIDVTIVTTEMGTKPYFSLDERVKLVNFLIDFNGHYDALLIKKAILHKNLLKQYRKLLDIYLAENCIDICISMCGKEIEFLDKLKSHCIKIAEFHSMQDYRARILLSQHKGWIWRLLGKYLTWNFVKRSQTVTKFVVLTKEDAAQWRKTNSNIVQIYNPCCITPYGMPSLTSKRFIAVGRLDEGKGYDYLIDAWELVNKRHPDWVVDIFGQGEWHGKIQQYIQEHNLSSVINLCGITKDVAAEFYHSSGYIMTSRYEGFPMVLLEAEACGLPVISFDCKSGPKEIVRDGLNGFLVPIGNVQMLADKICMLIESYELRTKLSYNSMELAKEFDIDVIMNQWLNLFQSLLRNNNSH